MQQEQLLLAQAIDYTPLVISADLPLVEAIALISQTWPNCCDRLEGQTSLEVSHSHSSQPHHDGENTSRGSPVAAGLRVRSPDCIIVMENDHLKGIFTEQDLIRLLSSGKSFHGIKLGAVIKTPAIYLQAATDQSIFSALRLFEQHGIQHLPVIDEQQQLLGLVTPQSIENALEPSDLQQGCRVENVMTTQITWIPSSASVLEVAQRMTDAQTSCVILTQPLEGIESIKSENFNDKDFNDKDFESLPQRPIGIITEKDILQLYHLGLNITQVSAETVMSTPIFSVAPSDSVWLARQRMKHYRIRHLAVIRSDGSLQGLMTQTHLMQAIEPLEMRQVFRALRNQHIEALPLHFLQSRTSALVQDVQSYAEILKSQQGQAELFAAIAERIQKFLSLPDILNNAVTEVRDFLQADRVLIYQFAADMSGTIMAESVGEQWPQALHSRIEDSCLQGRGHKAYGQGRRRAVDDIHSADLSRCYLEVLERFKVRANLVVPIAISDHLWGLLIAHQCSGPRHWENHEFEVLERLSVQMAIAIRQAEISLEKKQLEKQFLRIQRLESVGTLASGIAHDLNNILTPIIGIAQLLPIKLANIDPSTQQLIDVLYQSAKRGSDIVNQILLFARGQEGERSVLQFKHILEETHELIQNTFPRSIQIETSSDPKLWMIEGNATQIHQVLINLCINARDAMPEGGRLTLSASNLRVDESYVQVNIDAHIGPYIKVTVTDTGVGIDAEMLTYIFNPFFTTKGAEGGTGLGLSTVAGIVKEQGGFINVSSKRGRGTEFQIFLPAVKTIIAPAPLDPHLSSGEGKLILVVDDEAAIRAITQACLETYGYEVIAAQDGIEAIALFAQHSAHIDAVLMDMMMPMMDGETAILTLQRMSPEVKIIAMSGLAFYQNSQDFVEKHPVAAILSKPYTTTQLLETLQAVLSVTAN